MSLWRLLGIALLIVGCGLVYFGWQATDGLGERAQQLVTGQYSDDTLWQLIGGAAAAVVGLMLTLFGGKTR